MLSLQARNKDETVKLVAANDISVRVASNRDGGDDDVVSKQASDSSVTVNQQQHKFRGDIEAFRGFAVFFVVMYHLYPNSSAGAGVDVFFVLSGYCITMMLRAWTENNFFSLPYFYACRFRRLLPASTATIIVTVLLASQRFGYSDMQEVLVDAAAAATFRINYRFYFQETDYEESLRSTPSPLLHFWSLCIEEQLYLLFPILMFLMWKARLSENAKLIIMALTTLASLGYSEHLYRSHQSKACFFGVFGRWWEMTFGYLADDLHLRYFDKGASMLVKNTASLVGAAVISSFVLFTPPSVTTFPILSTVPLMAGTALLLAAGGDAIVNEWSANNGALRWLGKRSYSLYLWHWPLIVIFGFFNQDPGGLVRISVILVISGWYSERCIERPLRKLGGPRTGLGLGVICISMCLLVVSIMQIIIKPPPTSSITAPKVKHSSSLAGNTIDQHIALVNLSLGINFIPSDVQPTLRDLRLDDAAMLELRYCEQHFHSSDDLFRHCIFRERDEKVLVNTSNYGEVQARATGMMIAGDSHATNWFRPWHAVARELNVLIAAWTTTGCSLDGYNDPNTKRCDDHNTRKIEAAQDYNVLIVVTGNRNPRSFSGMINFVKRIHAGRRAVNSNAITVVNGDGPGGTPANIILENGTVSEPARPRDRLCGVDRVWTGLQNDKNFSLQYPGLYFIPNVPLFCVTRDGRMSLDSSEYDRLICPALVGSKLVYRDKHHISGPMQSYLSKIYVDYVNHYHKSVMQALCRATGSNSRSCQQA